ncbi:cysteine--tRNA ligase [Mycoplasma bradburyae]|uniref:Cysteine--tRNA ligase n=1 Tax=Mycoplasma bradburyae TaxID=2963128 RepID=A0ABT5GAE2_9MOLU|nr:cysteine--tRNA ligase [Mycoplasma bradburyae]MDC4163189.1 cysteine--tRNA ligase [Mycoplasma bradburyae]MDC4181803.1 cysteine--tRNA ligase [Mycoplasma bradburyae]MDC4183986.1 cysteine--tRNA ligase [Mycoplasma bradburyae]UTS70103.1 cysteine--tRNA ligase [Mycoplasma bradburyae]
MKLYDTLTRTNINIEDEEINIYVCGPTVYDHIHMGNLRPIVTFDVLRRLLEHSNKKVNFVHNITDIDDKIVAQATKLCLAENDVAKQYTIAYLDILNELDIKMPKIVKVTEQMDGIIDYVKRIYETGYAYKIENDVYLNTSKINNYGILSKRKLDEQIAGHRIKSDENKLSPNDFVLWKKTTTGIVWKSEFGDGRPGWHTECSYIIDKEFQQKGFIIHGGGIDLLFPHHENENAQNIALYNRNLANCWVHVGHLLIENEKMSKSLNNFIYVKHLIESFNYRAIRWVFYNSSYTLPLNFDGNVIKSAQKDIEKIVNCINRFRTYLIANNQNIPSTSLTCDSFKESLLDNLNFANATKTIWEHVKTINEAIAHKKIEENIWAYQKLMWCLEIYGIVPEMLHNDHINEQIRNWAELLANKDYENADIIRNKLMNKKVL